MRSVFIKRGYEILIMLENTQSTKRVPDVAKKIPKIE